MRIGILGCSGRVGVLLLREILSHRSHTLSGGIVRADSAALGQDLGVLAGRTPCGIFATQALEPLLRASDVVIDFSRPEMTLEALATARVTGTALVIGTTGFSDTQRDQLAHAAREVRVLYSSNMSVGVNLLALLTEKMSATLDASFDIEILEMHHRHKVDAPSGTALMLGDAAAKGRGVTLSDVSCTTRDGVVGPRPSGEIGFATLRGGDVIGEHTVFFAGEGERVSLSHAASNRAIYAKGALRAAEWLALQKAGTLFSMRDVFAL